MKNYTQYYYDKIGNKLRMYTGLSNPLEILGLDNIIPSADNEYSVTKYEYDLHSQLTKMTDPLGMAEVTLLQFDGHQDFLYNKKWRDSIWDVGSRDSALRSGMIITIEPALYIEEEKNGIRIEDDILVTENGNENLSKNIIKTVDEIEALMSIK